MRTLLGLPRTSGHERGRLALSVALATGAAGAAIALLATSGYLISRAAQRPQILTLMLAIVGVRAFGIARAVLRYGERLVSHDLALRQLSRLREHFFAVLVPLVPGSLSNRSGDLLSRFVADVDTLKDLHLRVVIPTLVAVTVVGGASVAGWIMLPSGGFVLFASLGLSALVLPVLSGSVSARCARRQAPARARLTSELIEAIDGASELALAGRTHEYAGRLRASEARLARIARGDALRSAAAALAGQTFAGAGVLAVLVVGVGAVHSRALSGVLLAALVFLALAAYESVLALTAAGRSLLLCRTAAGRLQELGRERPAATAHPDACAPRGAGSLRMSGVGYRYAPGEPMVLDGVDFALAHGETVALLGPSGSGKSTLAELLVRFRDPVNGSVSLDGSDMRELDAREIRSAVLLCAQDSHVFNTSIRENLLMAGNALQERELWEALCAVELAEWAAALPRGLDTIAGHDGERLSGGQRTRLALARALLSRARFVIVDEPTAHLEPELARRVMTKLASLCDDRGLLVITHDLGALQGFDRVLELVDGALRPHRSLEPAAAAA